MKYCKEYFDDVRLAASAVPGITALYNKKILITGSTGMLCCGIVDIISFLNKEENAGIKLVLAGRNKERIAKRFEGVLGEGDFEYVSYDATKIEPLDVTCDYFIHGASNADPASFSKEPVETMLSNLIGLRTILDAAKMNEGSRVLFISSGEIYGNRVPSGDEAGKLALARPYSEEDYGFVDILNPRSCYPMGNRAAETMCASYRQEYDIDFVIARSCHAYGPGISSSDSRATAAFTRKAAAKENIIMKSAGEQVRSYLYSLDSASALLTILLNGKTSEAYNIANSDCSVSIRNFARKLADVSGVEVVFENPADAEKKSYNMMSNSVLDATKLEALGWRAKFDLEKGIQATLKYL